MADGTIEVWLRLKGILVKIITRQGHEKKYWFEELQAILNTLKPYSSKQEKQLYNNGKCYEYRQQNRQKLLDEKKEYWNKNKDEIIKKHTIYRELYRTKINIQKKNIMIEIKMKWIDYAEKITRIKQTIISLHNVYGKCSR